MSEHSLPPDPNSWPSDPYLLLGVSRGVSSRDLRKAYLALIRSYKPEHSPAEFQKIRQAYESALGLAKYFDSTRDRATEAESDEPPTRQDPAPPRESWPSDPERTFEIDPPVTRKPEPKPDPWDLACDGDPESAYRTLLLAQETGDDTEQTFLQLYWLVTLLPALDTARLPIDWLIRGLARSGPPAGRLRELLRRELARDPSLALGDRVFGFFRRKSPPSLVLDVAVPRWKAARAAGRWSSILADVHSLRNWVPEIDLETWARVLMAASMNLAWAEKPDSDHASGFCREVEQLGHRQHDFASEIYQVEFAQIVKAGLDRLGGRSGGYAGLIPLLMLSWEDHGPEYQTRFRAYVDQIAKDPFLSLESLDRLHSVAPAVLGRLSTLLGGLDYEASMYQPRRLFVELTPVIETFLVGHRWDQYASLREPLLRFCLREAISPGLLARTLAEQPEFVLTGKNPLAQTILDDWPLRHAYRAAELHRQPPNEAHFGDD